MLKSNWHIIKKYSSFIAIELLNHPTNVLRYAVSVQFLTQNWHCVFSLLPNALLSLLVAMESKATSDRLLDTLDSAPSLLSPCASPVESLTLEGSDKLNLSTGFHILVVAAVSFKMEFATNLGI